MKRAMLLGLLAMAGTACTAMATSSVVIKQVYGGSGSAGPPVSTYNQDFVELKNISGAPVTVPAGGWSVQYASATGNFASFAGNIVVIPGGTVIPAGGHLLIGGITNAVNGAPLPFPADFVSASMNMSGTAGKVALVALPTALNNAAQCTDPNILDLVGYGTANCGEGAARAAGPTTANTQSVQRNLSGCAETDQNGNDFSAGTVVAPLNSQSPAAPCGGFIDCNNNGITDSQDISSGFSQDCNGNQVPDECDIASGFSQDCNGNAIPDSCDITSGVLTDNGPNGVGNGIPDGCEDCNANGIADRLDIQSGAATDCNNNGVPDSCDLARGLLTDCNNNGVADACEGAVVVRAGVIGTVQPAGVRTGPNGVNFWNAEGASYLANASYAAARWSIAPIAGALDAQFGAGNWTLDRVYLQLMQSNAAFTFDGAIELSFSGNDALSISPGTATTTYGNYLTDHASRQLIEAYTFTQITNGAKECHTLVDAAASQNAGMLAVQGDLQSGAGDLTLLISEPYDANGVSTDALVAATYSGIGSNLWQGPTLVIFATGGGGGCTVTCDYNDDGGGDNADVTDLANAIASDTDPYPNHCKDFNQDGGADNADVTDLANAIAGGTCP